MSVLHLEIKGSYWNECLRTPLQASRVPAVCWREEWSHISSGHFLKHRPQGHLTLETMNRVLFLVKPT